MFTFVSEVLPRRGKNGPIIRRQYQAAMSPNIANKGRKRDFFAAFIWLSDVV
jgi:hypothetical protein